MNKPPGFDSVRRKAEVYIDDVKKTVEILDRAVSKADRQKTKMSKVWYELSMLIRMVRAWVNGEYRKTPVKTIISCLAALLYFINPLDLIPDIVLGLGYLDDITVISFVLNSIRQDLAEFTKWYKGSSGVDL